MCKVINFALSIFNDNLVQQSQLWFFYCRPILVSTSSKEEFANFNLQIDDKWNHLRHRWHSTVRQFLLTRGLKQIVQWDIIIWLRYESALSVFERLAVYVLLPWCWFVLHPNVMKTLFSVIKKNPLSMQIPYLLIVIQETQVRLLLKRFLFKFINASLKNIGFSAKRPMLLRSFVD